MTERGTGRIVNISSDIGSTGNGDRRALHREAEADRPPDPSASAADERDALVERGRSSRQVEAAGEGELSIAYAPLVGAPDHAARG
jgi:hypothetical protein